MRIAEGISYTTVEKLTLLYDDLMEGALVRSTEHPRILLLTFVGRYIIITKSEQKNISGLLFTIDH